MRHLRKSRLCGERKRTLCRERKVDVRMEVETVWLTQDQMLLLFGKARTTIVEHIQYIFKEEEHVENVVCRKIRHTTKHGAIDGGFCDTSVVSLEVTPGNAAASCNRQRNRQSQFLVTL